MYIWASLNRKCAPRARTCGCTRPHDAADATTLAFASKPVHPLTRPFYGSCIPAGGYGGSGYGRAQPSAPVPSRNPHAGKVPSPPPALPRAPTAAASVTASAFASGHRATTASGSGAAAAALGRPPRPAAAAAAVPTTAAAPQQLNRSASLPAAAAGASLHVTSRPYRDSYAGAAQKGAQLRSGRARGGGGGGEAGFGALSSRARLGIFLALLPLLLSLWLCMVAWLAAIWVHHYAVLLTVGWSVVVL